jgi:putative FmdB family regulatory protein
MPVYEYACEKCGHEFEREQRISERPVRTCPRCRAPRARRLISRTSFVLKGSGWGKDLYGTRKPISAAQDGGDSKEAASGDSKGSSESDGSKSTSKKGKKGKAGPKAAA